MVYDPLHESGKLTDLAKSNTELKTPAIKYLSGIVKGIAIQQEESC